MIGENNGIGGGTFIVEVSFYLLRTESLLSGIKP